MVLAVGLLALTSACAGRLGHRIDDAALATVPGAERQAIFAAEAEASRARADRDAARKGLGDNDVRLAMVDKELEQAEAEVEKQTLAEELARSSRQPDRINAAHRARQGAGLRRKTAQAHEAALRSRRQALQASEDAAARHEQAALARAQRERAELCVRKGITPGKGFRVDDFVLQHREAQDRWLAAKAEAERQDAAARDAEARWKQLADECRAFGCPGM